MNKSILLTGAAGFVGSHLSRRLVDEGFTVVGVDNFITGRAQNIEGLQRDSRFHFIEADVSDPVSGWNTGGKIFGGASKFDWVLHFASPASPPKYIQYPIETMRVNAEGTRHLLDFAREVGSKFFFASTSEIYGDPAVSPQPETYWGNVSSTGPRSVYDEAKRYGEAMVYGYHRTLGLDVRVIRIFNTYGPAMDPSDGRVVTNLMVQALQGRPLTVYGDGSQTRSFQYVSDLVEGIVRLMRTDYQQPVNLGNPTEFTILEFARVVQRIVGSALPIVFEPLPQDDPRQRKPDISVARRILGWEPRVALEDGLGMTLGSLQ